MASAFVPFAPESPFCFSAFCSFGFGGSRRGCPLAAVQLPAAASLVSAFHCAPAVFVSCCPGVSALARGLFPAASVFSAAAFSAAGRGAFAARSAAMLRALAAAPFPLWLCWPAAACPPGLLPSASSSRCWAGSGSGSWAECAFAAGLGVPVFVSLPAGVLPPAGWGVWRPCLGGWLLLPVAPVLVPVQGSLF